MPNFLDDEEDEEEEFIPKVKATPAASTVSKTSAMPMLPTNNYQMPPPLPKPVQ